MNQTFPIDQKDFLFYFISRYYFLELYLELCFLNFLFLINFILSDKSYHLLENAASVSNLSKKEQNRKK